MRIYWLFLVAALGFFSWEAYSVAYGESQVERMNVPNTGWRINDKDVFSLNKLVPVGEDMVRFWAKSESTLYFVGEGIIQERPIISTAYWVAYDCKLDRIDINYFVKDDKNNNEWHEIAKGKLEGRYADELGSGEGLKLWMIGMKSCHSFFPERYAPQRNPNFSRPR
jgi:hypothetical protein